MVKWSNKLSATEKNNQDSASVIFLPKSFVSEGIVIRDISDRTECLEDVALWHHHEWLRTSNQNIDAETFGENLNQRVQLLQSHIDQSGIPFTLIAELSGQVIGTISLVQFCFAPAQAPSKWITNLFVLPEYRGQKVGSHLLECAEHLAEINDIKLLNLYTYEHSEFYQKREWCVVGDAHIHQRAVTVLSKNIC